MPESLWVECPLPAAAVDAAPVGRWRPATARELTDSRLLLSAALHDGARPPAADEGAVEQLLLAYEELASNALRHGRAPVEVSVTRTGHFWLLRVSDAATDVPPMPAVGRDAALGGLGLPMVARLSSAHGWTIAGDRKVVWACIDYTRAEPPAVPRPRGEADGSPWSGGSRSHR